MEKTDIDEIVLKLNYLNQTKGLIKEAIKGKDVEVADTDTFRSYAEKINEIKSVPVVPFDNLLDTVVLLPVKISHNASGSEFFKTDYQYSDSDVEFIESLDFSKVVTASLMFYKSTLTKAPKMDLTSVMTNAWFFKDSTNLEYVPIYEMPNCIQAKYMFQNCPNLTDESLNNIMATCISMIKLINKNFDIVTGLSDEQRRRCLNLSNYQALVNAGWTNIEPEPEQEDD